MVKFKVYAERHSHPLPFSDSILREIIRAFIVKRNGGPKNPRSAIRVPCNSDSGTFDFTGTQACRAHMHFSGSAIDLHRNSLDIGIPDTV